MGKPFIWSTTKRGFKILWLWKIALVFTAEFEYEKTIGFHMSRNAILFWHKAFAFGIGHSFRTDIEAYK